MCHSFPPPFTHDSLEDLLPDLAVVEGVLPAHLHGAHDAVLLEDVRAQPAVHLVALAEGELEEAQHEAQNSTWGESQGKRIAKPPSRHVGETNNVINNRMQNTKRQLYK